MLYLLLFTGIVVSWPLKIAKETGTFTAPEWLLQLLFWAVVSGATALYSRWLEKKKTFVWIQVPDDPQRFVEGRRRHTAFWIPVRYWPWIYMAGGIYSAFAVMNETPK